jgi:hypothetical protein
MKGGLPSNLIEAMGNVVVGSGRLEIVVALQAHAASGIEFSLFREVTQTMQFTQTLDLLERLTKACTVDHPDLAEQCKDWRKRAREAMSGRNAVVHSGWWRDTETKAVFRMQRRWKLEYPPLSEVIEVGEACWLAAFEGQLLAAELNRVTRTSPHFEM